MESIALNQPENKAGIRPDFDGDLDLARRCASGDERALREVFETHEPSLRKLIYRNLGSLEDAEELAASTLLRFWRSAHRYRGVSSLRSYLARIALNLCHDAGRKRRPTISSSTASEPSELPAEAATPAEPEEHPWADRIRLGMLQLGREDRELLSLYYLEDWDYDEICASLGITYDVLRTRLVRARKKLRTSVEKMND